MPLTKCQFQMAYPSESIDSANLDSEISMESFAALEFKVLFIFDMFNFLYI